MKNILILIFLLSTIQIWSQEDTTKIFIFSTENRIRFGNYLFSDNDYLRAYREYQEVLKMTTNDSVRFKLSVCLSKMGRYNEATDNFKTLFFTEFEDEAKWEFYKSYYLMGNFAQFRDLCEHPMYFSEKYQRNILKLNKYSLLYENVYLTDSSDFVSYFDETERVEIGKFYHRKIYPNLANPTTIALISAGVPGLGKVMLGQYTDGVTAFLFTGLMTFLAIDNFNNDHQFRGWLFTGLATLFYAGNIYGSYAAAQIYNAGIKFNFENDLNIYIQQNNYFSPKY